MDWRGFRKEFDKAILQTWTMRIVVVALSIVIIAQLFIIKNLALNSKTIILPPVVQKKFYITSSYVSKGYMINMGQYLSQILLNLNPENYKSQLNMFLQFADPSVYMQLKLELLKQMKALATLQISQAFFPKTINVKNDTLYVGGYLYRIIGSKTKTYEKTLKIKYKMLNGEFYVESVSFKKNNV